MGNFTITNTAVPGIVIIKPQVFADERGFFLETYQQREFAALGIDANFVQDNHSKSSKGVLRGLHFQRENTQAKLVRVCAGRVFDVGVDLRPNSPFFGKWAGVELSAENKLMLYVPQGFAHGFLVLSDEAEFHYKCSDYYLPAAEGGVLYSDPAIGIQWPQLDVPYVLSAKDAALSPMEPQSLTGMERWFSP